MPYEDLINNFKTPMYVFDINKLVTRINYLKSKFTNKSLVYAVKANTFVAKELDKYVDKFEICSNGEFDICNKLNINHNNILGVLPNKSYTFTNISFNTIPSYNTNKEFHKKEYNWVGYLFNNFDSSLYIAGDTDDNEDIRKINCDIAMIPIGGKFTMDYKEAAAYVNTIKPKKVIPIHYGTIVGSNLDANKFKELVDSDIEVIIPFL